MAYRINRTGDNVSELLTRVEDRTPFLYGTTEYWNSRTGYIPKAGEVIIYSDYKTIEKDGETVDVPGIKIGSGNGYVQDLAFLDDTDTQVFIEHIENNDIHVTLEKKIFWDGKLNVDDTQEVVGETLIFNRN